MFDSLSLLQCRSWKNASRQMYFGAARNIPTLRKTSEKSEENLIEDSFPMLPNIIYLNTAVEKHVGQEKYPL